MKFGRKPLIPGLVTPRLSDFRRGSMAPPPTSVDFYTGVPFKMFMNDTLSCCTISAIANGILQRTTLALGTMVVMPDPMVNETYFTLTGGPDEGLIETDVLSWFSKTGIDLGRQAKELGIWARVDHTNFDEMRRAIADFGSIYVGYALPEGASTSNVWDTAGPGVDGHCTLVCGYDESRSHWYNATWGTTIPSTDGFMQDYLEEAYVVYSMGEWLGVSGMSPSHFDYEGLRRAIDALT